MATILPFAPPAPRGVLSRPRDNGAHDLPRVGYDSAGRPEARKSAPLYYPLKEWASPADITRAEADIHPDLYAAFRHEPTALEELAEDWREFVRCVRRSPYSHGLVAVFTVIVWTVGLMLPILLGALQ